MQLNPSSAVLNVPGSGTFSLAYDDDNDELVSWTWELKDARGNPVVPFPEFGKEPPGFVGFSWMGTISENTRQLICPNDPTHGLITIVATATLKDKKGITRKEVAQSVVTFAAVWGGVMAASYPHPVDWDKPWGSDAQGQRALVLMFDLINQMPEELRRAAGSIGITRSAGLPFAGGFHAPYVSESIIITDGFVNMVTPGSATLTAGDIKFMSVVLHEIGHAVTYQRASVNVHGIMAKINQALRHTPIPLPNNLGVVSYALGGLLGLAHALLFGDIVSGFAHVAGWELTAWYFRLLRAIDVAHDVVDLGYWLTHLNETANWPAVNPNVITGYWGIGNLFGLRNSSINFDSVKVLQESEWDLWDKYQTAQDQLNAILAAGSSAADIAAATAQRDAAFASWKAKRMELEDALATAGAVSQYATVDVLEDIAETITAITFGAKTLNNLRSPQINSRNIYAFVTTDSAGNLTDGFARRLRYLQKDAGLFPPNWTPLEPGRFMRGQETFDQLDKWRITF